MESDGHPDITSARKIIAIPTRSVSEASALARTSLTLRVGVRLCLAGVTELRQRQPHARNKEGHPEGGLLVCGAGSNAEPDKGTHFGLSPAY